MLRRILELFRSGEMICPVSYPSEFQELEDGLASQVESALAPYGRKLVQKDDLYYCSYANGDQRTDRAAMREQFRVIRDSVAPIIDFITLVIRAEGRGETLRPTDTIKLPDLLKKISDEAAYQKELDRLSAHKGFNSHKASPNMMDRLNKIFEGLQGMGYLSLSNGEAQIYTVTGRIEHFYEVLAFIAEHEEIPLDGEEDQPRQGGLEV
ncbi:condensin complex protein MksE [Endozoicomonas ascidiicola]|uniref:condensin complex protein MksE n=1 Tax=Endozoicomonas ascidiicola TaxID=1698521 RepID=UPI00082DDF0B|nr:hypothetical protein [Endozoicomonas ascidiicola]USN26967.1 hypothetical protein [synthetic construct]